MPLSWATATTIGTGWSWRSGVAATEGPPTSLEILVGQVAASVPLLEDVKRFTPANRGRLQTAVLDHLQCQDREQDHERCHHEPGDDRARLRVPASDIIRFMN